MMDKIIATVITHYMAVQLSKYSLHSFVMSCIPMKCKQFV